MLHQTRLKQGYITPVKVIEASGMMVILCAYDRRGLGSIPRLADKI